MIGSDVLGSVLGAAPVGDPERLPSIAKAMIRAGLSPVFNRPGTKIPVCTLSPNQAKKADLEAQAAFVRQYPDRKVNSVSHDCGLKHVLDEPGRITTVLKRLMEVHGPNLNVGMHLGRSRMLVVDADNAPDREAFAALVPYPITVESPGFFNEATGTWDHLGGGHWYFTVPDEFVFPAGKVYRDPAGWDVMWGDSQVLVPPSVRKEGPYRLTGSVYPAPAWLLERISTVQAAPERTFELTAEHSANPIEQWAGQTDWGALLQPDGWVPAGSRSNCGCPDWTAPGSHASPKSATAHEPGCTVFDTSTGWGPLKLWTSNVPPGLPPEGAVTKFDYLARTRNWDTTATKQAIGVPDGTQVPVMLPKVPGGSTPGPDASAGAGVRQLKVTRASEITMRATRWSWVDMKDRLRWIPQGALTLLGGREGVGKSTLAYWIIAQITRGTLPGDNFGRPRSVIIAATEDAWEQTIVPRLVAAGADLTRVLRVDVVRSDLLMEGLTLPADVQATKDLCRAEDVGMILLDPLLGAIGGNLDSHKDAEVRQALEPLSRLAHDQQVTVIGLIHQNKSSSGDLLTRLMGSRAFSAVARAVLVCAREVNPVPVSQDGPEVPSFLFGQLKSNLGPKVARTLRYQIQEVHVGTDPEFGDPIVSSAIQWAGEVDDYVENVIEDQQKAAGRANQPRGEAGTWLLEFLAQNGPSSRQEVQAAGQQAGHSRNTIDRATDTLLGSVPPALGKRQEGRSVILTLIVPSSDGPGEG